MFTKTIGILELKKIALQARKDILIMLFEAKSGHTGGSLSAVDLLVGLYHCKLNHDPKNPQWPDRDRFILSKGHACPALYAVLAGCGYFPREELFTLRKLGSRLQGHPHIGLPGLECSSGSLGQGLSIANGINLAARLDKRDIRVYCMIGDGEMDEGQIWEAAMTASHYRLDNLCVMLDFNKFQIDGKTCSVKDLNPVHSKWQAFGFNTIEIDGHDMAQIAGALDKAEAFKGKPSIIIAHTVKGKGVSFIESDPVRWHGVAPKKEELEHALAELEKNYA